MPGNVRVSIGVPVYNGENFLTEALDSLLAQTFPDFEIIISDNASTDTTQEICLAYAAKDIRIRYHRNEQNLGAAPNFNLLVNMARGEYFKWAAHDDLLAPTYLEKCVAILDQDTGVVVCHSAVILVDETGKPRNFNNEYGMSSQEDHLQIDTGNPSPSRRYHELIVPDHMCYHVFGVMRTAVLKDTQLIGKFSHGDGILLGELGLRGRFAEVPEPLFFARRHARQFMATLPAWHRDAHGAWFDTRIGQRITFPWWRILYEQTAAIWRAPISLKEKLICHTHVVRWLARKWSWLGYDVIIAARRILKSILPQSMIDMIKNGVGYLRKRSA